MPVFLAFIGIVAWLFAAVALLAGFAGGTDIQLIAAGVYGTFGAVSVGCSALIIELRKIRTSMGGEQ